MSLGIIFLEGIANLTFNAGDPLFLACERG